MMYPGLGLNWCNLYVQALTHKHDTRAILNDHVEAEHQDDMFKYLCCQCDFSAEGPSDLTEH